MNQTLWNGVGNIGCDLIADADRENVRRHFANRKRSLWVRYGSIAACLCLVVCLCIPLMTMNNDYGEQKKEGGLEGFTLTNTDSASEAEAWTNPLAYRLELAKTTYSPTEVPVLSLKFGLTSDVLGGGTLKISVETGDFTTTADTEVSISDYIYSSHTGNEADSMSIPLVPANKNTFGNVAVSFLFYPDDVQSFEYAEFLRDGALNLKTISISYVIDEFEIVFSKTNAYDLYEIRLAELYKRDKISEKQFADRYFALAYKDTVCASVCVSKPDGSYSFVYLSKNIRYESPYITDTAIREAMGATDESEIVRLALVYMLDNGVISQAEYDSELAWVAEVRHAGYYLVGFDQNVAKYSDVLQSNMYTHN